MPSNSREIISVQIGAIANAVSAEFWNIQENILDHQYSEGISSSSVTGSNNSVDIDANVLHRIKETGRFPRAISLNWDRYYAQSNIAYKNKDVDSLKENAKELSGANVVVVDRQQILRKRTDNNIDSNISGIDLLYFQDLMKYKLDPSKSIHQLDSFGLNILPQRKISSSNNLEPNELYMFGKDELYVSQNDKIEQFFDGFRYLLEECDHIQGLILSFDSNDCFGGLTSNIAEIIRDDFTRTDIIANGYSFDFLGDKSSEDKIRRVFDINDALSFESINQNCSLYIPMSKSFATVDEFKEIELFDIAATIHDILTPFQLTNSNPRVISQLKASLCNQEVVNRNLIVANTLNNNNWKNLYSTAVGDYNLEELSMEYRQRVDKDALFLVSNEEKFKEIISNIDKKLLFQTDVFHLDNSGTLKFLPTFGDSGKAFHASLLQNRCHVSAPIIAKYSQALHASDIKSKMLMTQCGINDLDDLLEKQETLLNRLETYNYRFQHAVGGNNDDNNASEED